MSLTGVEHALTEYGAENMTTASYMISMIVYPVTRRECGWRRKMGKKEIRYFITSLRAVAHGRRLLCVCHERAHLGDKGNGVANMRADDDSGLSFIWRGKDGDECG
ncbi:hypothetical protein CDEST_07000 [Colletotrichum destructivum]|uniref:Uncharacterized protein n=1 Tax=Colletotrichum destructivum TaxID=34406 RepID=A0AAX4IGC0_9PEZI|nr:hypothetical protein CDEST_07000 [Colletotrichum destructivum]